MLFAVLALVPTAVYLFGRWILFINGIFASIAPAHMAFGLTVLTGMLTFILSVTVITSFIINVDLRRWRWWQ